MPDEKEKPKEQVPKKEQSKPQQGKLPEASLAQLIFLLGTQAMQQLGMVPNPLTKKTDVDLTIGKFSIDLLGTLQEKTSGNRTKEEDKLLDDMLFDLRMRYIELTKKQESK